MGGQGLSHRGDLLADLLEFAAHLFDLGKGRVGGRCLGLQGFQLLLRLLDLALERIILLLGDLPFLQLFVCLLRRRFQCGQFLLGILDSLGEKLLLLPDQFRIGGIKLQQLFDILQLCLGALDVLINTL